MTLMLIAGAVGLVLGGAAGAVLVHTALVRPYGALLERRRADDLAAAAAVRRCADSIAETASSLLANVRAYHAGQLDGDGLAVAVAGHARVLTSIKTALEPDDFED